MPHVDPPKKVQSAPEEHAAREASSKPSRDDVHEQRQGGQKQEGVVQSPASRPPAQSLIDQQRGDWEGMGQSQHVPDAPAAPKPQGAPTPGANSLAGNQK